MKTLLGVLLAMLLLGDCMAGEMFTCRQADGSVSYQQMPCAELPHDAASQQDPEPLEAAPAALPPPVGLTRRKREVLDLTVNLQRCRTDIPGFAERAAPLYVAWQRRHAATLSEQGSVLSAKLREARRVSISPQFCGDELLVKLDLLSRTPDPRLGSVEKTWGLFMQALKAADRDTARLCLTGKAEARWKQKVEALSDDELRRLGSAVRAFKVQWGDDYLKEALAADDRHVAGVVFENLNEEWRISDL